MIPSQFCLFLSQKKFIARWRGESLTKMKYVSIFAPFPWSTPGSEEVAPEVNAVFFCPIPDSRSEPGFPWWSIDVERAPKVIPTPSEMRPAENKPWIIRRKLNSAVWSIDTNLNGSSSSVLESRVMKERGPGGFVPLLFFSNENTLWIELEPCAETETNAPR